MPAASDPVSEPAPESVPLGQRLFDNWLLLLIAGIAIMVLIYTGWGVWEVLTIPPALLP